MDFIHFKITDFLDIFLVAVLLYQLWRLVRRTNAVSIFVGIITLYLLWVVVRLFNMELLSSILGQIIGVGAIALIVVFQPEIRKFLFLLGDRYARRKDSFWNRFFFGKKQAENLDWIKELCEACRDMATTRTGALVVIARRSDMTAFTERGDAIDAVISRRMIETIFFKNSPMHDGAMVIEKGRVRATRCLLPVSERADIPAYFGTRHRAAIGAAESSDALVVVVSEERGQISFVDNGNIRSDISPEHLGELIRDGMER